MKALMDYFNFTLLSEKTHLHHFLPRQELQKSAFHDRQDRGTLKISGLFSNGKQTNTLCS
jgi:hypothetical protein